MADIGKLQETFRPDAEYEFDHAPTIFIEPGKRLTWRKMKAIREAGYKIQHITNKEHQTAVSLVVDDDA